MNVSLKRTSGGRKIEKIVWRNDVKKNLERSQEEVDENIVYKVVGRKGEKREIRVTLRQGEELDDTGKVIRIDGWARGRGGAC